VKVYKEIWNNLSTTFNDAAYHVCCLDDEDEIRRNGVITAEFLRSVLRIRPTDTVLEIGCGVARIGRELAPLCGEWHGCDISGNMIAHARERTAGIANIVLHELPECSLRIFPDNTFDRVYSTIVFMHLDKVDMFTYMREAYRVLKPGGQAYFDTYNLLGPDAWKEFLKILELYPIGAPRPGHLSQFSTPQEVGKFMSEARFEGIHIDSWSNPQLVAMVGYKADPARPGELEQWLRYWRGVAAADAARGAAITGDKEGMSTLADPIPDDLAQLLALLTESRAYALRVEAEVARKNAAIADLERRLRRRERELVAARQPRLAKLWQRLKRR
jgi:ubiquinone/menaquinone biosynthesis C-methylase UbiE